MIQEDKSLLIKDLCGRLPYGVKFHYSKHHQCNIDTDCDETAIGYYYNLIVSADGEDFCIDRCKLYLRPMSSMTEEEKKEYENCYQSDDTTTATLLVDFYNKKHFDYRGLFEKNLAIDCTNLNIY